MTIIFCHNIYTGNHRHPAADFSQNDQMHTHQELPLYWENVLDHESLVSQKPDTNNEKQRQFLDLNQHLLIKRVSVYLLSQYIYR